MNLSGFKKGVFLVNVLAIIHNPKKRKILIGLRKKDPYLKNLSWCFPGGRPSYNEDLEDCLKIEVLKKTGLKVKAEKAVFAKTYPEKREFLSIYYYCQPSGGKEIAGEKFLEIKWVKPAEVKKYFTTSLHPKVYAFLKTLH